MSNNHLQIEIYGESHAEKIGVIIDGLPAGFRVDITELEAFLSRRAPGNSPCSTARREPDKPVFVRGLPEGVTDGGTLEAFIVNQDVRKEDYEKFSTVPRPGHADYGAWLKTGRIPSGGGRWSGRMTALLCIAGGICKQILAAEDIEIEAEISRLGGDIEEAKSRGDSVGGDISCRITGVKAGVGNALFDGIESEIARLAFAIPAVKGIEFGDTKDYGSENNDAFVIEDGEVRTATNNCGGILGGISTGMPIEFKLRFKPTPSIGIEQDSVDLETMQPAKIKIEGRHDPCILPRALPCVEAVAAIAIYSMLQNE